MNKQTLTNIFNEYKKLYEENIATYTPFNVDWEFGGFDIADYGITKCSTSEWIANNDLYVQTKELENQLALDDIETKYEKELENIFNDLIKG